MHLTYILSGRYVNYISLRCLKELREVHNLVLKYLKGSDTEKGRELLNVTLGTKQGSPKHKL